MKNFLMKCYFRYKGPILYIFFGGITTLINIISYYISYKTLHLSNVTSTILAWIFSVIFAFISNKIWVFESKSWNKNIVTKELVSFVSVRLLTGFLDVAIMYIGVDLLNYNGLLMKIASNLFVLVSNYIGSKLFIFKKQ
ncbi:GtrA family protein [uncultured Helcococcus sp.]|uniref:GtrA family protein n=1 Tax=uncultured Helcococcus sp. TaxID=1072508 RepID=UPI00288924BE|nr:GtrA family protein [uncultured Helcococcus sp.]